MMRSRSDLARVAASNALLDRGFGKPPPAHFVHFHTHWRWPLLPFAAVVFVHVVFRVTVGRRRRRQARMIRRGLCPNCGYDLRASTDRCPECGRPAPPANEWIKLLLPDSASRTTLDKP